METANEKIIYKDLSYQVVGAAFEVFIELGWGLPEKDYQRALAEELRRRSLPFREQVYFPIKYKSTLISKYFADFVVDEKILLELKVVPKLGYAQAHQVLGYLKSSGLKLGILVYFTRDGVKYRRILNSAI
jgi:GxxExxY protein